MQARPMACLLAFAPSLWACSCPDSFNGVRDRDRMRITVVGPYGGPFPSSAWQHSRTTCGGAVALPPGSEVTLNATFGSTGEACPSVEYTAESITAPDY